MSWSGKKKQATLLIKGMDKGRKKRNKEGKKDSLRATMLVAFKPMKMNDAAH